MAMTEEQALQNLNGLIMQIRQLAMSVDQALDDNKISGVEPWLLLAQSGQIGTMAYSMFVVPSETRRVYVDVLTRAHLTLAQPWDEPGPAA